MAYEGIHFTPPEGTIEEGETSGEAMVNWKLMDGKYTITEFDGKPVGKGSGEGKMMKEHMMEDRMPADEELDSMATE